MLIQIKGHDEFATPPAVGGGSTLLPFSHPAFSINVHVLHFLLDFVIVLNKCIHIYPFLFHFVVPISGILKLLIICVTASDNW